MISSLSFPIFGLLWASLVRSQDCVGTIASMDDVARAVKCKTVHLKSFTVPPKVTLDLALLDGATVNMLGNISFAASGWAGPLCEISGHGIFFNGNGHFFNGEGPAYWDGLGDIGLIKPRPMMKIRMSGTLTKVGVINSPAQAFSVSNPGPLTISHVTIDNSLGDHPNARSSGRAAGHNTDGFDCTTNDLSIQNSWIWNQDDCIAINGGNNISISGNTCIRGHGISLGSIRSNFVASNIQITGNTIIDSEQALRIKTVATASNAKVTDITYSGNKATGCSRFGVLIDQSYPAILGKPGNGVALSDINFIGAMNEIHVKDSAMRAAVNCGSSSCSGVWDWSKLKVTGGVAGPVNYAKIKNWTQ